MLRTRSLHLMIVLWSLMSAMLALSGSAQSVPPDSEFFEKRVRPLLAAHCYSCHSGDSRPLKGSLRLDSRSGLLKGGEHGPLITPGKPESSLLIRAIRYTEPGLRMPPSGRLTDEQIGVLVDWIKRGAALPPSAAPTDAVARSGFDLKARARHWAWQPIKHPAIPVVRQKAWVRNPIDAFVLAKLEAKGLSPAHAADKRTVLRRVTYDLIGLPPTPAEIHAFLADNSPNAYEKVVDRLLASPHYGERWGRHWLDLVRYAETDGHEWDMEKTGAWQYRDYVIRALNADVPYNQFVLEHIAGDLLPRPRLNPVEQYNESVLGTGFFFLGSATHSPVDLQDDEAERTDNQIDVLGKAFLGMGIGCARCHDHKFDAITTQDYYALYGFLKAARLQEAPVGRPVPAKLRAELESVQSATRQAVNHAAVDALRRGLDSKEAGWTGRLAAAKKEPGAVLYPLANLVEWTDVQTTQAFALARNEIASRLREQWEKTKKQEQAIEWLAGPQSKSDTWSHTGDAFSEGPGTTLAANFTNAGAGRLTAVFEPGIIDSGQLADRLAGALRSPTFTIDRPNILYHLAGRNARVRLIIDGYQRIRDPIYGRLAFDVESPDTLKWYELDVRDWIGHRAYIEILDGGAGFVAVDRVGLADGGPPGDAPNPLILKMLEEPAVTSADQLVRKYRDLFEETAAMAESGHMAGDAAARWSLMRWALNTVPMANAAANRLAELAAERTHLETGLTDPVPALAATDGSGQNERVHVRGNYRTTGREAPRRFLEVCDRNGPVTTTEGSGRLELAARMLAPTNPLPARVIVNRLWQHHFGEGIVRTPDDFGVMGDRPTHPELLDWLAATFTAPCQPLTRIAESTQSKIQNPTSKIQTSWACGWSLKKLHRLMVLSNAYRMDSVSIPTAEASDPQNRLLHRMPVRRLEAECVRDAILTVSGRLDPALCGPPVMPYLNAFTPGRGAPSSGPLDGAGRRSIYLSVRRNFLIPMFLAFDYPNPITTIGRRTVSNVSAQALTLLNNPFVAEQAQVWARRTLAQPGTEDSRLGDLYEAAFGRLPRPDERAAALAFLEGQAKAYGNVNDPRSWGDLCHVLFNVKEFIFLR